MKKHLTNRWPAGWLLGLLGLLAAWPAPTLAQTKSAKRGLAYDFLTAADLQALAPGLSWWYGWGPVPKAAVASIYQGLGAEFVPMQWNATLDGSTVTADRLAAKIPAGAKYLLGFNEPNFRLQANLTPKQAAALWPVLQDVAARKNLKLVSPAVNYCGDCVSENGVTYYSPTQYLDAFFAACPNCQVDYIAVHTYVCEEQYLRQKIAELKKYNKPIWLTEFSCGDMDHSRITLGVQKKYLIDAVNYLENEPAVFRYSWFSGRNNEIPNINLLGADGQLTELGQLYVNQPYAGSPLLANRLTPVAATAQSSENSSLGAANAIDGNINTRWASAWTDAQYFQLDFGTAQKFSHVRISWDPAYAADYKLLTSPDGNTWTPIQTVINGDGGVDDFTGLAGSGRYLRVACSRRGSAYGYSIYEINAYGSAATTTPAPTPTPTANLIQAENYSSMSGVGVETTSDTDGGRNVGYIDADDKMTYNAVNFPTTGSYSIEYRVASPNGGSLATDLSGAALGTTVPILATGGWQKWTTISQTVSVTAGTYNLGIRAVAGGWNLNWLRITPLTTAARPALRAAGAPTPPAAGEALEVYPNPVTDRLQLRSLLSLAGSRYQILNALGQSVASGAASAGSLDVSGLQPGMYTLLLTAEGQRVSRRFVK
ncbi:glycosyl hydrolase [uncultured Hymenobacter sp.]|uniref:glycosyl hydrolase n=1 Tax=uncultured Hymenobacter sp. TaxID=170016 RepID=UPI0035C9DBB7